MNRPLALVALFAALSTAACAGSSADDASGDGAAAAVSSGSASHIKAVQACNTAHDKAGNTASSTVDMIEMEGNWGSCLETANNVAVKTTESILKKNGSSYVGTLQAAVDAARKADQAICAELDNASESFGGTLSRVESAGCYAQAESFLAALVDDYVAFPSTKATYIAEDRKNHAACYATYDAAGDKAVTTADMVGMNVDLGTCILAEASALTPAIAAIEVENDATFGPAAAAKSRLDKLLTAKITAAGALCSTLSEAGENGTGTLSRVSGAGCTVRVIENAYTTYKTTTASPEGDAPASP